MGSLPAERKALLFSAGGVRLALSLSQVQEIVAAPADPPEVTFRGAAIPGLPVALSLGLPAGPSRFAIVTEGAPRLALMVEELHGIIDLAVAEVFQLPARFLLPQPSPFQAAVVSEGAIALELAVSALDWAPAHPPAELSGPPPELDRPAGRELYFARGGRTFAVALQLLARVLDCPTVHPVPLAPPFHRGLIYHGRAIHPAFDVPVLYGDVVGEGASKALLVEAGGNSIALLADRILPEGDAAGRHVARPSWDLLFAGA